jgi:uncharacterized damage-inducible protein DinB
MSAWREAVENWERCRRGLVAEIRALKPEFMDVRPAEGARTAREIAEHLYQASQAFIAAFEKGGPIVPGAAAAVSVPPSDDLAELLMQDWTGNLRPRLEPLEARAGTLVESMLFGSQTLLSQAWFALAHEWYHRGQMATYVRLSGGVPALTQFIRQRQAARPPG